MRYSVIAAIFAIFSSFAGAASEFKMTDDPRVIKHGSRSIKQICLTIDDGWYQDPELLGLLKTYNIQATLFLVGQVVDRDPEWVLEMIADGHEIANHTYTHVRSDEVSADHYLQEIQQTEEAISRVTGVGSLYFRPTYGVIDSDLIDQIEALGLTVVLWDVDLQGYRKNQTIAAQVDRLRRSVQSGSIILSHFGYRYNTFEVLKIFIPEMLAKGYRFVPLSKLRLPEQDRQDFLLLDL